MATMERPNVYKRVKTEDVTATSGMTFRDFNLDDAVQFVSQPFWTLTFIFFATGRFWNGLRAAITYSRAGYSQNPEQRQHHREGEERNRKDCCLWYSSGAKNRHEFEQDLSFGPCTSERTSYADLPCNQGDWQAQRRAVHGLHRWNACQWRCHTHGTGRSCGCCHTRKDSWLGD